MAEKIIVSCAVVAACAVLTAVLILALMPTLQRHFIAIPNERSSHKSAVPQAAGLAIMAAMLAVYVALWALGHLEASAPSPISVLSAAVGLTLLGALDDAMSLPVSWRFAGQAAAAILIVLGLPDSFQILPGAMPLAVERLLLVIGTVAFINAVNFLDGIDWITVAQTVPMTLGIIALGYLGAVPDNVALLALVLLGGVLGFAVFNKHPARIFLGDAGSLPIGLCLAWMLIFVARADIVAALLLPLYTLSDSGLTLGRRIANGEKIFSPHRSHFYQRALTLGFKAPDVTTRIFILGSLLAVLAVIAAVTNSPLLDVALLLVGAGATGILLRILARGRV
ncbi:glycosyl transferase [Methyloligella sp. 2.7D]|uniref:glycosyl transferase n=1 Tax=unclassified Methyloligella TaxID=2625955 RepID=UPI00157BFF53|nr:glycosyl transferase [Methyloligella sp. GL2]QKP78377.1 glycosyl transferase [Methyloligella sp. GL2]